MARLSKKGKLIMLFFCGFLAGFCLEIILVEKRKVIPLQNELINSPLFEKDSDTWKEIINITCLVLIKHQHVRYVDSSKKTWLKHCSNYYIVNIRKSSKHNDKKASKTPVSRSGPSSIKSNITRSENDKVQEITANNAWGGLCRAFHFINPYQFQWLVIIPDSLLVLVENLRLFVRNINYDNSHYYGYTLKHYEADYNILSAGILLSRGTVKKLLVKFTSEEDCDNSGKYWKNEDMYLGKYLKQMNILPKDSRDEEGRGRFHGFNLNNILWPGRLFLRSDYNRKALYPVPQGFNCCSPYLITVEVSDPDSMQNLFFFLCKIKTTHKKLPNKAQINKTEGTFWKDFLQKEGYSETEIENMTNEEYYKIWEKKLPLDKMFEEIQSFLKNNREELD